MLEVLQRLQTAAEKVHLGSQLPVNGRRPLLLLISNQLQVLVEGVVTAVSMDAAVISMDTIISVDTAVSMDTIKAGRRAALAAVAALLSAVAAVNMSV